MTMGPEKLPNQNKDEVTDEGTEIMKDGEHVGAAYKADIDEKEFNKTVFGEVAEEEEKPAVTEATEDEDEGGADEGEERLVA